MGQKVSAHSIRLGIVKDFSSRYYPENKKDWSKFVVQDKEIRNFFDKKRRQYGLASVEIERKGNEIRVILNSSKPGVVLGQGGEEIKSLELGLAKTLKDRSKKIKIDVIELKDPDLSAQLAADEIAIALENRGSFRVAQKRVIRKVMNAGAKGIKTRVSGRLNGVDMARAEGYSHGVVPLATFRNDIDYGFAEALTTYGIIGIKVWISKGEVINGVNEVERDKKNKNQKKNFKKGKEPSKAKKQRVSKPVKTDLGNSSKPEPTEETPKEELKSSSKTESKEETKVTPKETSKEATKKEVTKKEEEKANVEPKKETKVAKSNKEEPKKVAKTTKDSTKKEVKKTTKATSKTKSKVEPKKVAKTTKDSAKKETKKTTKTTKATKSKKETKK